MSVNVFYFGRKIWTVTAPSDARRLEKRFNPVQNRHRRYKYAQNIRHYATYLASSTLTSLRISFQEQQEQRRLSRR